ncbi:carbohydrate esterase, partial [Diplogelasinospora grovesii]
MKLSWCGLLATSLGLAAAHGNHDDNGQHVPRMLGGKKLLSDMKLRRALSGQESFAGRRPLVDPVYKQQRRSISSGELEERQTGGTDGQCGPGVGSCASGYCCSPEGWCGKTTDYCESPDCQLNYGSGCDGNKKPAGADTSSIARPKLGSIPYGGAGIYDCVNAGDIAVTFDDGPYIYTSDLLDKLK